jgi:hypothetical protein
MVSASRRKAAAQLLLLAERVGGGAGAAGKLDFLHTATLVMSLGSGPRALHKST